MPYSIIGKPGSWKLILRRTGQVLGTHETLQSARKQIAAIELSKLKRESQLRKPPSSKTSKPPNLLRTT